MYSNTKLLRYVLLKYKCRYISTDTKSIFCQIYLYFQEATYTHCNVTNIVPSISASIGTFSPQTQIWQACVYIHSVPRFLLHYIYWNYFRERRPATKFLTKVTRFTTQVIVTVTYTLRASGLQG